MNTRDGGGNYTLEALTTIVETIVENLGITKTFNSPVITLKYSEVFCVNIYFDMCLLFCEIKFSSKLNLESFILLQEQVYFLQLTLS